MIPETIGAVVGFLIFIAPGVLWELLRERVRPPMDGSPFREASRVALMSVVLSGSAVVVVAGARALWPPLLLDPGALIRDGGQYVGQEYARIAWTVGLEIGVGLRVCSRGFPVDGRASCGSFPATSFQRGHGRES